MTTTIIGTSGRQTAVHKQDCEGVLMIDPMSGNVLQLLADRPDWATELTVAQVAERDLYYGTRLGDLYTEELKVPEVLAFEDLSWLCVRPLEGDHSELIDADPNYDGFEHFELSADEAYRSHIVANVLGITEDLKAQEADLIAGGEGNIEGQQDVIDLSAELLASNFLTQEEIEAREASRKEGFEKIAQNG